ncbi:D-alanyl-D-alanine carboxypeptidase (penicillin-binding protein 5/6) [Catenulispora sp. GAS73]|uniref:D-alanyl-D-alanine carboxypeptidase family protein n=1 Tax=Catenulispora sp. GAS73 TaxID=3156269 RepID=UPI0035142497
MPNPELEEQAASERPEIPAAEPESERSEAAAPAVESAPGSEAAPGRLEKPPAQRAEEPTEKVATKATAKAAEPAKPAPAEPAEKSAGTPSASAEKPRRRRRPRLRTALIAVGTVLALGGGTIAAVYATRGGSPPQPVLKIVPPAYRALAIALPWPQDGETALWAQGIGNLGTCGDQTPVPIASVAKVMTAYVILKDHPLTDGQNGPDITVDQQAESESYSRDESSAPVRAGQRISERSLLELMLIPSANNVARLLARWDAGDQVAFVDRMNNAAAELGMRNTTYTDPSGLDATTRSTAADQLLLAESALTDPTLLTLTGEPTTQVPNDPTVLPNTDSLLGSDGVIGGKTGSSTPAGGALMWAADRTVNGEEHLVLGVVLHQASGTSPEQGLYQALIVSRRLIEALI